MIVTSKLYQKNDIYNKDFFKDNLVTSKGYYWK